MSIPGAEVSRRPTATVRRAGDRAHGVPEPHSTPGTLGPVILLAASDSATANLALMPGFMDPFNLIGYFGAFAFWGLLLVILIESGVLFPVLPGDSLLFVAGLIAAGSATG